MAEAAEGAMEERSIHFRIQEAMRSRIQHFRDQADSLTFEGVRRLLEKDLELDVYALDAHKRYVKELLEKFLADADGDIISKDSGETKFQKAKEEAEPHEVNHTGDDVKECSLEDEEKMEDSPVMGLLAVKKSTKSGNLQAKVNKKNEVPSESKVIKAIFKRSAFFRANSEEITMAGVRRLLEEDLGLDEYALDPLKKLISAELDEVLGSPQISKVPTSVKKKHAVKAQSKGSKKNRSKGSSDSSDNDTNDSEPKVKQTKKVSQKGKVEKSEVLKKRKPPAKETQVSKKKQNLLAKETSAENGNEDDNGDVSESSQTQSSGERPAKKKEVAPPPHGKQVEHLKLIIKSCGMSVPPSIYKRAKQSPDDKREAFLIKELGEILSKEGLSADPSEKEIKDVKRRKERAKELEGIDASNIVLSSRRRSSVSFVPPPKPKINVDSDGDDTEDSDSDDEDEGDEDNDDNDDGNMSEEGH